MDFVVVFHLVLVPDFANIFLVRDATTKHLTEESGLDVQALAPSPSILVDLLHNLGLMGFFIM